VWHDTVVVFIDGGYGKARAATKRLECYQPEKAGLLPSISIIFRYFTISIALREETRYNRFVRHNKKCRAGTGCTTTPPPAYGERSSISNRIIGALRILLYRLFAVLYRGDLYLFAPDGVVYG
jgi:hypothetical protein